MTEVDASSEVLVAAFAAYERTQRGQAELTVVNGCYGVRQFLAWRTATGRGDLDELGAEELGDFAVHLAGRVGKATVANRLAVLRIFLRFLYATGRTARDLAGCVPCAPVARFGRLPRAVDASVITALLDSCDRTSPTGRRDYAILMLMARLGLRAIEVHRLHLDDIDWRTGEIEVVGKGQRHDRLPLPADVGEALAEYLCARPASSSRAVFLAAAGTPGAISRNAVVLISRRASRRAGLSADVGGHRLRHSLATDLLARGATLREVGQVLRHGDETTTAIYAKVDQSALAAAVRAWPGAEDQA